MLLKCVHHDSTHVRKKKTAHLRAVLHGSNTPTEIGQNSPLNEHDIIFIWTLWRAVKFNSQKLSENRINLLHPEVQVTRLLNLSRLATNYLVFCSRLGESVRSTLHFRTPKQIPLRYPTTTNSTSRNQLRYNQQFAGMSVNNALRSTRITAANLSHTQPVDGIDVFRLTFRKSCSIIGSYNEWYKMATPIPKNHAFIFDAATILKLQLPVTIFFLRGTLVGKLL